MRSVIFLFQEGQKQALEISLSHVPYLSLLPHLSFLEDKKKLIRCVSYL